MGRFSNGSRRVSGHSINGNYRKEVYFTRTGGNNAPLGLINVLDILYRRDFGAGTLPAWIPHISGRIHDFDTYLTIARFVRAEVLLYTELSILCILFLPLPEEKGCPSFERHRPPASDRGSRRLKEFSSSSD